jgi:hypothetical protein
MMRNSSLGTPRSVKAAIHEPVAPYFVTIYGTLISIVQSLVLGFLLFSVFKSEDIVVGQNLLKAFVVFVLIGLIWHRYITYIQYLGYPLGPFDTMIPLIFAVIQFVIIWSLDKPVGIFAIAMTCAPIWGILAYTNVCIRSRDPNVRALFYQHFADQFPTRLAVRHYSDQVYEAVHDYGKISVVVMGLVAILFVITIIIVERVSPSETVKTYLYCGVFLPSLLVIFGWFDLRWIFSKRRIPLLGKFR